MILSLKSSKEIFLSYQNGHFYFNGELVGSVPLSKTQQILSHFRLSNRLLRLEPRQAVALTEKMCILFPFRGTFSLSSLSKFSPTLLIF